MKIIARLLVCLGVVVSTSSGQSYSDLRGISPFHSYDFTDTDTVELSHGNVILNIPIVSYKQKGQLPPFEVKLVYNAKNWEFSQQVTDVGGNDYYYYIWDMNAITVNPYNGVILPRPNGVQLVTGKTYDINWMVGNTNPVDPNAGFSYIGYRLDDNASGSRPMAKVTGPDLSFAALDASGLTFVSPTYFSMDAVVRDPQGVSYSMSGCNPGCARKIADRFPDNAINGFPSPSFPYSIDHWVDSLNRTIPQPADNFTGCTTVNYPGVDNGNYPVTFCRSDYTASTSFPLDPNDPVDYRQGYGSFNAISSVTLPNGSSWSFEYNSWGELKHISNPLGASVDYEWTTLNRINACQGYDNQHPNPYDRAISKRTVTMNGKTLVWTYDYPGGSTGTTIVTTPEGHTITHYFGLDCGNREFRTEYKDKTYGPQQTVDYEYGSGGGNPWQQVDGDASYTSVVLKRKKTTLAGGKVSQICNVYDNDLDINCDVALPPELVNAFTIFDTGQTVDGIPSPPNGDLAPIPFTRGSIVKTVERDYGSSGPGTALRITKKSYKWQEPNSSFLTAGMLDRPGTEEVRDGNSSLLLTTTYSYDDANGSPQGTYGDLTKVTRSGGGATVVTSTVFNGSGMPTQYIDGNLHTQDITYDGNGIYPQKIVAGGLANEYSVDLNTGVLTSQKDPNGVFVKYVHNDTLGRLTSIQSAYGISQLESDKTYAYPSMTQTSISQDLNQTADGLLQSRQSSDGLGRTTETTAIDGTVVSTLLDSEGRATAVSNPHYSGDTGAKYTSYLFDVLGGVRRICNTDQGQEDTTVCAPYDSGHPDTSAKTFQYTDNQVTYTDEIGHAWTRTTDALGRLTDVGEPGGAQTHYIYDALGNLKKITQDGLGEGARVREFFYDGLSRLIAAKNPEQGSGLTCSGAQGSQWSICYSYDGNGNVHTKTIPWKDSSGSTTTNLITYNYDDLNRLSSKSYSDGITPASCFQYGQPSDSADGSYLIGRLLNTWTQLGTCSGTVPQSPLTRRAIVKYDPMGRVKNETQCVKDACTSNTPNSLTYGYDLAGNNTLSDNGLGTISWQSSYDTMGRLTAIAGNTVMAGPEFPTRLFNATQYGATGITDWTLGGTSASNPALTFHRDYDSRLRVLAESVQGHQ